MPGSRKLSILIILLFSMSFLPLASAQSPEIQSLIKLEQAQRAMVHKKYEKALGLYEEILTLIGPAPEISYKAA